MHQLDRGEKQLRIVQEASERLRGEVLVLREQFANIKDASKKAVAQTQIAEARASSLEKQISEIKIKASAIGLFAGGSTVGIAEVIKFIMST